MSPISIPLGPDLCSLHFGLFELRSGLGALAGSLPFFFRFRAGRIAQLRLDISLRCFSRPRALSSSTIRLSRSFNSSRRAAFAESKVCFVRTASLYFVWNPTRSASTTRSFARRSLISVWSVSALRLKSWTFVSCASTCFFNLSIRVNWSALLLRAAESSFVVFARLA
ncbi:hypothetical protein BJV77DRAFT_376954 [Russula vinacea]|nr:hypothetical protein BJV77DRAFT_376954 [Russula vinacea]